MKFKNIIKKDLFSNYHPKLVAHLTKTILQTTFLLNFLLPIIFISQTYKYIPLIYIKTWIVFHLIIFFSRIYLKYKLDEYIKVNNLKRLSKFLNYYLLCIFITSILIVSYAYESLLYNVPHDTFLILLLIPIEKVTSNILTLKLVFYLVHWQKI